jgi:CDP-paratose 2-epimerase
MFRSAQAAREFGEALDMKPETILVTGSSGLIGSEAVEHFDRQGHRVVGVDNNMRRVFFGAAGDTTWNLERLKKSTSRFEHRDIDIRDRERIFALMREIRFDAILHCAAQPSHDKAKEIPLVDFEVNAMGTANLLEATRQFRPEARFVLLSTNKVYGDAPNEKPLDELATRYEYADPADWEGISEECRIDRTTHSVFGASKVAADVLAQEYGRYFGLSVGVFRGGCLTGPSHSGVELHGFLSYLIKCALSGQTYTVFGYKGKQVRDNIHSYDVIRAAEEFFKNPRPGEVYNMGGGRENSISMLEAIAKIEQMSGKKLRWQYDERARKGDHMCYISDLRKFRSHYPDWELTKSLDAIFGEIVSSAEKRRAVGVSTES